MNFSRSLINKFFPSGSKEIEEFISQNPESLGLSLYELATKYTLPKEWLYWARNVLTLSQKELELYNSLLEINNAPKSFNSFKISNSNIVFNSNNISDSKYVFSCKNVKNSNNINTSSYITNSLNIFKSSHVDGAQNILDSKNVSQSSEIIRSTFITFSKGLSNCKNVHYSAVLRGCENVSNVRFSTACKGLYNSFFCFDLNDKKKNQYFIFNQEINEELFVLILNQFQGLFNNSFIIVDDWNKKPDCPFVIENYNLYYNNFTTDFYEWIQTLPYYNEDILYSIKTLI